MFNVPFNLPSDTLYKKLDLEPSATSAEISNAINRRIAELNKELADLQSAVNNVEKQIPELKDVRAQLVALTNSNSPPDANLQQNLQRLENQAEALDPNYKQSRHRLEVLENENLELNKNRLNSSENRQAYDKAVSLFALLHLPSMNYDFFSDNKAIVSILRTDLSQFLEARGENVYYPSDLARTNFESEFSPTELLDGFDDKSG